jgi:tetratricopeptide (TPR) repeat protein
VTHLTKTVTSSKTATTKKENMTFNMTKSKQYAIGKNNLAVSLIETGNYQHAIKVFSLALKTFKHCIANSDEDDQQPTGTKCLDQFMTNSKNTSECRNDDCQESENNQYIYRHAIRIPLNMESDYSRASILESDYSRASIMVSSMLVIFNIALAHQLLAITTTEKKTKNLMLRKAAKFYELAFKMQEEAGENLGLNIMFTLAIVNNLGLLHDHLNDGETSTQFFEHLLSILMYLTVYGEGHVHELDGFYQNASAAITRGCSASPAA